MRSALVLASFLTSFIAFMGPFTGESQWHAQAFAATCALIAIACRKEVPDAR